MSCVPGVPSFGFSIGDTPTIRFPTFNVNGNFNQSIKMNLNKTNKSLLLSDILQKSTLKLPLPDINGTCEDYISPSVDFKNDDIGGLPWVPLCLSVKKCKKCVKTVFGRACINYPCGINASYSYQPYWENKNINIPDKTILNFDLPSIEIGMNISIKSSLSIGGCIASPYAIVIDAFNSYLQKNPGGFSINLLVQFLNQAIANIINGEFGVPGFTVIWDILTITLDITITNCYIKVGSKQINIPDFNIQKTENLLGGANGSFLYLAITPPADISFNINVLTIDVWVYVIDNIVKNIDLATRLTALLGPVLANLLGNFNDGISTGTKPVTDWLKDHLAIYIYLFGRICPLNLPGTQFLICSSISATFTPFTQSEINMINNKVASGLNETTNALTQLKLPAQSNNNTKDMLHFLGIQKGKGFNELIDDGLLPLPNLFNQIIEEMIDEILSLNFNVSVGQCIIPPV